MAQRQGNDKGKEPQDLLAVDRKGILAEFTAAIGKDIHKFQPLNGKETKAGV